MFEVILSLDNVTGDRVSVTETVHVPLRSGSCALRDLIDNDQEAIGVAIDRAAGRLYSAMDSEVGQKDG